MSYGVEHLLLVQHLISDDPGHKLDVTVPEQQPLDILTHTPVTPLTEQVFEYEHEYSIFVISS